MTNKYQWFISRCNSILVLGWIFGSLLASANPIYADITDSSWVNLYGEMNMVYVNKIYWTLNFIVAFVIPIIILSIAYISIGKKLLQNNQLLARNEYNQNKKVIDKSIMYSNT